MSGSLRDLRGIELLRDLPRTALGSLEQRCRWQRHAAGDRILDRESTSRDVFFVVEGRVRVVDYSRSGREVVYAEVGAGGHFGELAAIDQGSRSATVIAAEPCLLAALAREPFESLVRAHPDVAMALLRGLVRMVRTTDERIVDLTTLGAMARVCRELLRLALPEAAPGAWSVRPMPTHRDLAARTGTTRETVARALAQLRRDGLVERAGRGLRIADRAALEAAVTRYQNRAEGGG